MYLLKSSRKSTNVSRIPLLKGILILALVLGLNRLCGLWPWFYENIYFKAVFQFIRVTHDYTLGLIPIPCLYIVVPLFFYWFFRDAQSSIKWWILTVLNTIIWILIWFYVLWGFNYNQATISERLELQKAQVDSVYIDKAFKKQTLKLDGLLNQIDSIDFIEPKENDIRIRQEALLDEWGIPTIGRVRVRKIWPGLLLHFRTSGIYIPHAFEGHLDRGLYYRQHPFTMAHEMSHGYGITDESEANFVAYLTCINSNDLAVQYSGELAYWRYLAKYYKRFHRDTWQDEYAALNPKLVADLKAIRQHILNYKDLMPKYRDVIYDSYLKSHGVQAGIKSYDQMIMLIAAYERE